MAGYRALIVDDDVYAFRLSQFLMQPELNNKIIDTYSTSNTLGDAYFKAEQFDFIYLDPFFQGLAESVRFIAEVQARTPLKAFTLFRSGRQWAEHQRELDTLAMPPMRLRIMLMLDKDQMDDALFAQQVRNNIQSMERELQQEIQRNVPDVASLNARSGANAGGDPSPFPPLLSPPLPGNPFGSGVPLVPAPQTFPPTLGGTGVQPNSPPFYTNPGYMESGAQTGVGPNAFDYYARSDALSQLGMQYIPPSQNALVAYVASDQAYANSYVTDLQARGINVLAFAAPDDPAPFNAELLSRELDNRPTFIALLSPQALQSKSMRAICKIAYDRYTRDARRVMLPIIVEHVESSNIWLFLRDFSLLAGPQMTAIQEQEAVNRTIGILTPDATRQQSPLGISDGVSSLLPAPDATQTPESQDRPVDQHVPSSPPLDSQDIIQQANHLRAERRYFEALQKLDGILIFQPENAIAWYNRGLILWETRLFNEALDALNHALQVNPRMIGAWKSKASLLFEISRFEEVVQACDVMLNLYEKEDNLAPILIQKGAALWELNRRQEAATLYDEAMQRDPNSFGDMTRSIRALINSYR